MYSASYHRRGIFRYLDYIPRVQPKCHARPVKATTFFDSCLERLPLVEETEELASNVLAARLLVVHDTGGGGQDNVAELTRGKELGSPLLEVAELDGVAGVDDTALVETGQYCQKNSIEIYIFGRENSPAVQLDDDLAGTVVIDLLELANVA